ncbi:RNA polymerase sigma-70 factor (ECF subfamily) [Nocardia mexicana]|uniref:RNA polymerase sigma-70 factor (ECF subfamily) n=2 Tax=Nocardia mexicana TaxID=279262 RepID=A0A370GS22_9NOCA|nr:RNA polymerase sigma-70 factor (ECF subfamily) [Nocardia mexicana]
MIGDVRPARHPPISELVRQLDTAAAARGDRSALAKVLRIVHHLAVRYCRARAGSPPHPRFEPDRVAHEICLAVMAAFPGARDRGRALLATFYDIAADRVAAQKHWDTTPEPPRKSAGNDGPGRRLTTQPARPPAMTTALAALPPVQREILILRVAVGLSAAQTAVATGTTVNAIRFAQHRALANLEAQMFSGR